MIYECIPADQLYKYVPVLTIRQSILIGAILGPPTIVLLIIGIVKLVKTLRDK